MALIRQPKSAGFRLKSRYDILVDQLSNCLHYQSRGTIYSHFEIHTLRQNNRITRGCAQA